MMRWMPINVPQNLTRPMSTLRPVSSCYVADRAMVCLFRLALPSHKMFTLKPTKPLGRSVLQGPNGEILHLSLHLDHPLDHPRMAGEADLLKSILRLSLPTRMISENKIVDPFHLHRVDPVRDKSNR